MLEQFIKSILSYFVSIEPMNVYIQKMPNGVQYPCYFLNKCDVKTHLINAYYYLNTVTLHFRIFSKDEIDLKNKVFNLSQTIFDDMRKIPILNQDGTLSQRYIRLDDIETIEIPTQQNDVYCIELVFNFDTTHNIVVEQFDLIGQVTVGQNGQQLSTTK